MHHLKICIISGNFPPVQDSIADDVLCLGDFFSRKGISVSVITTKRENIVKPSNFQVFPIIKNWNWKGLLGLLNFMRRIRPDIIDIEHAGNLYNAGKTIYIFPFIIKCLWPKIKVVTKVHEVIPYDYARLSKSKNIFYKIKYILFRTGLLDPNYLFMLKFSDWIIVSNEEHQRFLEDYFPHTKSKIKLILSGINVEPISDLDGQYRKKIRQDLRVSDSEIIFSFLGFIIVRKGIDTLIYALKDLILSNHKIKLLIIGGREHLGKEDINFVEEMDALIKNLGLKEHVTWTGYCSHKEVSSYLLASDVCVLPFDEGVSLKRMSFITAVAHSLPLITTKGETLSKMLVDGENVVLVPPKNPHALASAMLNLVSSKELRHKLSVSALKLAEQFSWDKYVDKFISLYSMGS